jgi:hypothetical protein
MRACRPRKRRDRDLTENGYVLRYRTDENRRRAVGQEGTFLICSFWLVPALAVIGELQRARNLMEAAACRPPLGSTRRSWRARGATSATSRRRPRTPHCQPPLGSRSRSCWIGTHLVDPYDAIIAGPAQEAERARHLAPSGKRRCC